MTVLYTDRTLPLSSNASNTAFSSGVDLAWDFTGVGSLANGEPWIYVGATKPTLNLTGTSTLTTVNGEKGRVASASSLYDYTNLTNYGLQTGSGDFTIALRLATPATLPVGSNSFEMLRISGTAGTAISVYMYENPATGWYFNAIGSTSMPIGSTNSAVFYPANTFIIVWIQRIAGVVKFLTQDASLRTDAVPRNFAGAVATTNMDATWAAKIYLNYASAANCTVSLNAVKHWGVGLSDASINAIGKDFWDTETNNAVSASIALTSPANGATIQVSSTISGTYLGTAPTGVEVQHGSGAWVAGTSMTISGGNWSGLYTLPAGIANTLKAREANATTIVSNTVTGIVVNSDSISFTKPSTITSAQNYRQFQRNASNQASVRISGTTSGTVTNLEYRWNGSPWTFLATPSAGAFDATVTLQGVGQSNLEVRFANNTSVIGTLLAVGVCDVFLVAGQSNHVGGGSGTYVPPVAPAGNSGWVAVKYGKDGVWRPNLETVGSPFSDTTNAVYSIQAQLPNAYNSYFGRLATRVMEKGYPIAFVPCAMGSTTIANWSVSASTNTLYGAMAAVATTLGDHKAVLWWQGEADCSGVTRASYEASLNAIINAWYTAYSRKFILMNLNATGNGTGSGGTTGTDTGYNAIHAAIANVAATNANVTAIADMNGTFSSSIHYATAPEIDSVSLAAFGALNTAYYSRKVILTLTDAAGNPLTNLTGLKWALFDQITPDLLTAPASKGLGATTNASGVMSVDIPSTTLGANGVGWFVISTSDGTTTQSPAPKAFSSTVVVP